MLVQKIFSTLRISDSEQSLEQEQARPAETTCIFPIVLEEAKEKNDKENDKYVDKVLPEMASQYLL